MSKTLSERRNSPVAVKTVRVRYGMVWYGTVRYHTAPLCAGGVLELEIEIEIGDSDAGLRSQCSPRCTR